MLILRGLKMEHKIYFLAFLLIIIGLIFPNSVTSQSCSCDGHIGQEPGCPVGNQGQPCGNCGTIDWSGACSGQGVCSPGQTQCSGSRYQTCSNSCGWVNSGTDSDNDGVDQQCEDATCDNAAGVCDSAVANKCIAKSTPEICTDGLDNDCNGQTDSADSFCNGQIQGIVKDNDGNPIDEARVSFVDENLNEIAFTYTNVNGNYGPITLPFGSYKIIASHPDYVSQVIEITLEPRGTLTVDFTDNNALVEGTVCEDDCTYAGDNTIHKECNGINGCNFYDAQAALVCDLAQPGWIRDYSSTQQIQCPEGSPYDKVEVKATVTCAKENLIKTTQIVNYQGKLVKMIVAVCG